MLPEFPVPDMSELMSQTERATLVLQIGCWLRKLTADPVQNVYVQKTLKVPQKAIENGGSLWKWLTGLQRRHNRKDRL